MALNILVVEDHPLNLQLVRDLLEAEGYAVLHAGTAEEGLAIARKRLPALILMDISLPGMDGLAATRILKADPATQHIPVVALTAHAMKGDAERAFAGGADGYLTKPIDTRAFPRAIAELLHKARGGPS